MAPNYTYGELASTLTNLGFVESVGITDLGASYRAFDNAEHDAWIMLPNLNDTEPLDPAHLRAVERTVEGKGVVDRETFKNLLRAASNGKARAA